VHAGIVHHTRGLLAKLDSDILGKFAYATMRTSQVEVH
jgi:hypothetical protein